MLEMAEKRYNQGKRIMDVYMHNSKIRNKQSQRDKLILGIYAYILLNQDDRALRSVTQLWADIKNYVDGGDERDFIKVIRSPLVKPRNTFRSNSSKLDTGTQLLDIKEVSHEGKDS